MYTKLKRSAVKQGSAPENSRGHGRSWCRQQTQDMFRRKQIKTRTSQKILPFKMFTDIAFLPSGCGNISQIMCMHCSPTTAGMETDIAVFVWTPRGDISGQLRMTSPDGLETHCSALPIPSQFRVLRNREPVRI